MKTISFFNLKGGCGKTTSVINLGCLLAQKVAEKGQKILYVDSDMQSNLTNSVMEYNLDRPCIYHLLTGECSVEEVIYPVSEHIDMIPSSLLMATIEPKLAKAEKCEYRLQTALQQVADRYAFCLIDCSPSFSVVTTNAVVASEAIFIPVQTEYYAVDGVHLLEETLDYVSRSLGIKREVTLLFATLHDVRNNINRIQYDNLQASFGSKFMKTVIRKNVALVESPIFKESIFEYKPRSKGAKDYLKLFKEIESKGGF